MILTLWTAEEDAIIVKGRAAKLSAAHIAIDLPGRTRNAVIGRVNRLLGKGIEVDPAIKPKAKPKVVREKPARVTVAKTAVPIVISQQELARIEFRKRLKHGALGGAGRNTTKSPVSLPKVERREDSGVDAPPESEAETIPVPTVAIELPPMAPQMLAEGRPVAFDDLKLRSCRFPTWPHQAPPPRDKMMFCGKPMERGSYCAEHAQLCYQPLKPSQAYAYRERRVA